MNELCEYQTARCNDKNYTCRCSCFQLRHSKLQVRSWANSEMRSGARNGKSDRNIFFPTFLHVIPPFRIFSSSFSLFPIFSFPTFIFSTSLNVSSLLSFTFTTNLHLYLSHFPSHNKQQLQPL